MQTSGTHSVGWSHKFRCRILCGVLTSWLISAACFAQAPPMPAKSFRDRVVDRVTLTDGIHLWGMILSTKPTRLFIRTSWVQNAEPEFWADSVLPELNRSKDSTLDAIAAALQTEIDRIPVTTPNDQQRSGLLKEIHQRLSERNETPPEFLVLEFPKTRMRGIESQPNERRELCRLAILNNIPDIESTHWKSVTEQLQRIPVAARKTQAPSPDQDEKQTVRQILAAVDVRLNSATRLVQQGENVFDESAEPDLAKLMSSMMGGNVESLLGQLLGEGSSPPPAAKNDSLSNAARNVAESKNHSTIVVTSFEFQPEAGSATVTRRMFRKMPDDNWSLLVTATGASTIADLKPGQVDSISNDPQIKQIAAMVEGLGLGGASFSNAIQLGAVVRNAMRNAEQAFEQEIQGTITTRVLTTAGNTPVIKLAETAAPKAAP